MCACLFLCVHMNEVYERERENQIRFETSLYKTNFVKVFLWLFAANKNKTAKIRYIITPARGEISEELLLSDPFMATCPNLTQLPSLPQDPLCLSPLLLSLVLETPTTSAHTPTPVLTPNTRTNSRLGQLWSTNGVYRHCLRMAESPADCPRSECDFANRNVRKDYPRLEG